MNKLLKMKVFLGGRGCLLTFSIVLGVVTGGMKAAGGCGCIDLALVVDDSGSIINAQNNIKAELPSIIAAAQAASGGDLRIGLVSFPGIGLTNDGVLVRQAFTADTNLVTNAVQALAANGGNGIPESSDSALQYVVAGTTDTGCTISNAPLGSFRSGCVKVAVLITDAPPGGCHDTFTTGVDDVHAAAVANQAAAAGVLVSAIYVPTGGEDTGIKAIMQNYADASGGVFVETAGDGTGTGEGIADIIATCGGTGTNLATRTSRFWFTHVFSSDPTCATLLQAIQLSGGRLNLGFVNLPVANRNADNVIDSNDALIEALGFAWRSTNKTGENGGTQSGKLRGSKLCKARKGLAVELTAALANSRVLRTRPSNATYFDGVSITNFPSDLIQQARTAASGEDLAAVQSMTALLKKFNSSGVTNDFPSGLVDCGAQKTRDLKKISRDATTQITCPGLNSSCDTAESVFFSNSGSFAAAVFKQSVNLSKFTDDVASPTCGTGGRNAAWQVKPTVGTTGRQFTASTGGSNFDTMISVWAGGSCSNLTQVACVNNVVGIGGEQVSFTTDGTNTYRIVVEGASGGVGKLNVRITSP